MFYSLFVYLYILIFCNRRTLIYVYAQLKLVEMINHNLLFIHEKPFLRRATPRTMNQEMITFSRVRRSGNLSQALQLVLPSNVRSCFHFPLSFSHKIHLLLISSFSSFLWSFSDHARSIISYLMHHLTWSIPPMLLLMTQNDCVKSFIVKKKG